MYQLRIQAAVAYVLLYMGHYAVQHCIPCPEPLLNIVVPSILKTHAQE